MRTNNKKFYRLNYQIRASQIRLLDETGKQIGIVKIEDALRKAQQEQKDLVEIAPKAQPPVVKLIDFKKFKYIQAKKEREAKRKVKNVDIKGIRLSPFMAENDFNNKMKQAENFLKEGNQLKIMIPFKGRSISHKEFGMQIVNKAIEYLKPISKVVKLPYFEGRVLVTILASAIKNA